MSEENVDVIKRAAAAFNETGLASAAEFFAEDAEFHEPPEQPAPRVAHGLQELIRLFGQFDEAWLEHKTDVEEIRAIGTDKVLVLSTERFVGRDGIEVEARGGGVFTLRNGKITKWQAFWERQSALEAAGISE